MAEAMRIRAIEKDGNVDVRILMRHDMITGLTKDAAGKTIPAHFIQSLTVTANGKVVLNAQVGPSVSKDPVFAFRYKGAKGEKVVATWVDNKGDKRTDEATVS